MTITIEELLINVGSFVLIFIGAIIISKLLRKWIERKETSKENSDK